jgi:putative photosynthetic complex assembly protein 2
MLGASAIAAVSLVVINQVAPSATSTGAWLGFVAALGLWSWIETSFLTGWITGPRKTLRPGGATGWRHAFDAIAAILWHELAIIIMVGVVSHSTPCCCCG